MKERSLQWRTQQMNKDEDGDNNWDASGDHSHTLEVLLMQQL